jgi:steroid delta-isomerase-like uncharacterized protein
VLVNLVGQCGNMGKATLGGSSSAVERQLPKLDVAGSIPVSRSISLSLVLITRDHKLMQDNPTVVRRFVEEVINQGRMESAAQFVHEDVVEQVPLPGQGPGLEGLKDVLRQMRTAFPDLHFSLTEQIAEGERVASRFEWTGTHKQPFMGVPATGRQVRVWGVVIDRLEGGRIKDTRIIMDTLGLMMQLGVFPPPGA